MTIDKILEELTDLSQQVADDKIELSKAIFRIESLKLYFYIAIHKENITKQFHNIIFGGTTNNE